MSETAMETQPVLPGGPRWPEFCKTLGGPGYCDFRGKGRDEKWTCKGGEDKSHSEAILRGMGLAEHAIAESLAYFEKHGGYCDCEVLFNVDGKFRDLLEAALKVVAVQPEKPTEDELERAVGIAAAGMDSAEN